MRKKSFDIIMGIHSPQELLRAHPGRILKVYAVKSDKKDHRKKGLTEELRQKKIPLELISKDKLSRYTGSDSHQGFAALIKRRQHISLEVFIRASQKEEKTFVLMLDSIYDPHNVGAILRSSECFGVSAVIWSTNRGVSITPTVSKVSSGASELVNVIMVSNLANAVDLLKKGGFSVISSNAVKESISLTDFSYPSKTVLILGSEGEGVRPLLQKKCDHSLVIPMQGKIDSLNVSSAAAVFLSKI